MQEKEITIYKESLKEYVMYQLYQFRFLERLMSDSSDSDFGLSSIPEIFHFMLDEIEKNIEEIFEHEEKYIGHTVFTKESGTMKILRAERAKFASE